MKAAYGGWLPWLPDDGYEQWLEKPSGTRAKVKGNQACS